MLETNPQTKGNERCTQRPKFGMHSIKISTLRPANSVHTRAERASRSPSSKYRYPSESPSARKKAEQSVSVCTPSRQGESNHNTIMPHWPQTCASAPRIFSAITAKLRWKDWPKYCIPKALKHHTTGQVDHTWHSVFYFCYTSHPSHHQRKYCDGTGQGWRSQGCQL